jgi:hypothetical protein
MYTVVLFALLFLLGTALYGYKHKTRFFEAATYSVLMAFVGGVLSGIVSLFLGFFFSPPLVPQVQHLDLASFKTVDTSSDTFLLGSPEGQAWKLVYHASIKNSDGTLSPWSLTSDSTAIQIVEDPNLHDRGTLVIRSQALSSGWLSKWILDPMYIEGSTYEFDIPAGSFQRSFQAN